ncbi:MAG: sugar transporter [Sodalis sp. (in: enterobacteria)]|uniref:sugar transporter n=1 Tax=Sodalis sp. (in: enterobacteria) TaxID=1898979 RepID=UPI003F2ACDE5
MFYVSDRTQRRGLIAAAGLSVEGILLPLIASSLVKMAVITLSIAWFTSYFTTNIWSIITSSLRKEAVGAASGIINGIGAGVVEGTTAGFVVEFLHASTGSYLLGFVVIGAVAIAGGLSLYTYWHTKGAG